MTNPYSTSAAEPPPWTPPKPAWWQILLGVLVGIIAGFGLNQIFSASILPTLVEATTGSLLAVYFFQALMVFASTGVAGFIGSKRVVLPLLLVQCVNIFAAVFGLSQKYSGQIGTNAILAHILPKYALVFLAIFLGGVFGHYLFSHRRRPGNGSNSVAP